MKTGGGYMKLYRNLLYNPELNPNDIIIFTILSDKCESAKVFHQLDKDGFLVLSIRKIAELARIDRRTVAKSLEKLEKLHLIAIDKCGKGNSIRISAMAAEDAALTVEALCG